MKYYTLGNTGLKVSRLALGTMTFGEEWGWGSDDKSARHIFNAYVEAGGNFLDTADLYTNGHSEQALGQFVRETGTRDKVVIASKFSFNGEPGNPNAGGNGRKNILRAVEGSLKRLNTDYIDLYFMHVWDQVTPAIEVMSTLNDLVRSGKVRYIAVSNAPAWYIGQAQTIAKERGWEPFAATQIEYSLIERHIEHEYVSMTKGLGTGIIAWSPLAGGLLSGKYKPSVQGVNGEGRLITQLNTGSTLFERFTERNFQIVKTLEQVANELGRSMAQVALNWVANRPGVSSILIGATKLAQLHDNLQALDFTIPTTLLAQLDAVSTPALHYPYNFFGSRLQNRVTGGTTVGDKPIGYHATTLVKSDTDGAVKQEEVVTEENS